MIGKLSPKGVSHDCTGAGLRDSGALVCSALRVEEPSAVGNAEHADLRLARLGDVQALRAGWSAPAFTKSNLSRLFGAEVPDNSIKPPLTLKEVSGCVLVPLRSAR